MPHARASDMALHVVTVDTRAKPPRRDIEKGREGGAPRARLTTSRPLLARNIRPPVYSSVDRMLRAA
jgi:hypothetical protein